MTSLQDAEIRRRMLAGGWLAERPPEFQAAVLEEAWLRRFETGQFTHHLGDGPGGFYGVVSGSFAALGRSSSGVAMGHIVRRGSWIGEGPMISGQPRKLAFRAMEPSEALCVTLAAVERITRRLPDAARQFATLPLHNQDVTVQAVADLLIRRSDRRIAAVLLRVTDSPSNDGPDRPEDCLLTQSDLAEMANASRHRVNAVLRNLEARGWLRIGYGRIAVLDRAALQAHVAEGE